LYSVGLSTSEPLLSIDDSQLDKVPPNVLERTRSSIFEIVVPASAILERHLDVLPAESLPYLETVVRHQMESTFPWRASDILHSIAVEKRADGKLDVSVCATSRSAIASALAAAEACGAGEVFVVSDREEGGQPQRTEIPAAVGAEKNRRLERARRVARYAAVALVALAVFVVGWTTFAGWSLSADVADLDRDIADRRAILKRAIGAGGASHNALEEKKKFAPVAVAVLDELAAVLPDNTYLTDLSLDAGHLRITGVSTNAAGVVPLLEGSGRFRNAVFYAPTTRLPSGGGDRFSIETTLVPALPVTP
jgi:general secretion pathway protein L